MEKEGAIALCPPLPGPNLVTQGCTSNFAGAGLSSPIMAVGAVPRARGQRFVLDTTTAILALLHHATGNSDRIGLQVCLS